MLAVPRLRNPGLDIKGLDSFPKIKYELCKKGGRIGTEGSVESALWQKPIFLSPLGKYTPESAVLQDGFLKEQEEVVPLKLDGYLYSKSVDS